MKRKIIILPLEHLLCSGRWETRLKTRERHWRQLIMREKIIRELRRDTTPLPQLRFIFAGNPNFPNFNTGKIMELGWEKRRENGREKQEDWRRREKGQNLRVRECFLSLPARPLKTEKVHNVVLLVSSISLFTLRFWIFWIW